MMINEEIEVKLKRPHKKQGFVDSKVPRIVVKAGRRGGKTIGAAVKAVRHFLAGGRVLYGAPTQDQVESFWWEVTRPPFKKCLTAFTAAPIVLPLRLPALTTIRGTFESTKPCFLCGRFNLTSIASLIIIDDFDLYF